MDVLPISIMDMSSSLIRSLIISNRKYFCWKINTTNMTRSIPTLSHLAGRTVSTPEFVDGAGTKRQSRGNRNETEKPVFLHRDFHISERDL